MKTAARAKATMLAALAAAAMPLFADTYSYNGLSWTDTAEPGQWTSRFADAKAYAKKFDIPLIAVWADPDCGYCRTFENTVGGSSAVNKWMADRKYMFVFALGRTTSSDWGMTASDCSAALSFARTGLTQLPVIGVWWPKDKNGKEVKRNFTGRNGHSTMPVTSGSLANQFMESVDQLVGEYASIPPKYLTVTLDANGGSVSPKTRLVENGKAVGTLPTPERSGYVFSGWFTAKTGGEQISKSTTVAGNVTYYAQWLKGVILTLSASPSAAAGTVTGAATYREGETVTVKAAAKKGYVFSCWKNGSEELSKSATFKYTLGFANVTLTASFVSKEQDLKSVSLKIDDAVQTAAKIATNTVPQGVKMEWPVVAGALTVATPSARGLPSGLKLVKSKDGTYSVTGVPTAASKVDSKTKQAKPSVATFKVKTAAGNTVSYKLAIVVEPMPTWATGAFEGRRKKVEGRSEEGRSEEGINGLVSLTVAASGKISGKMMADGLTWTLSATSFTDVERSSADVESPTFHASVIGKSGKMAITNELAITAEAFGADGARGVGVLTGDVSVAVYQNLWKTEPWKTTAKQFAKAKALEIPLDGGAVTLKFASSGAVTAKGVFGKYSASCSSVLIPQDDGEFVVFLYFPPKAGKFEGYAGIVRLVWDGAAFAEK